MKKAPDVATRSAPELKEEYRFDYSQARPNRFAARFGAGSVAVVLEPDVARVFQTSESVNTLLRSVLQAVPRTSTRPAKGAPRR